MGAYLLVIAALGTVIYMAAKRSAGVVGGGGGIVTSFIDAAKNLIADFEGYSATAYLDENDGWTIGYGHLIKSGEKFYPYGSVTSISRDEADLLLISDMSAATKCVDSNVKVAINSNQKSALVSFVFNVGCEAFKSSTLLKKLNAGDFINAANEFNRWVYDDGKIVNGLVARRSKEKNLFLA